MKSHSKSDLHFEGQLLYQDLSVGFTFVGGRLQPLIKIMLGKRT